VRIRLRPIQNFFQGAILVLALLLIALISAITTMHFAIHGAEVRVPVLKGMTVVEARSQTAGLRLNLEVDNRYYSADIAAGHILSQSPVPGAVVRREWRVRVAESLGPQKVEVPSVLGNQERMAALNLRRVGLETGTVARLPWPKAETGTVLAQDPPPRAQGIERPSIGLLVAAPDDSTPNGFVMPDLSGLPVLTAQAALSRVGLKFDQPQFRDVAIPPVSPVSAQPGSPASPASTTAASSAGPQQPPPVRQITPPSAISPPGKSTPTPGAVVGQQPPAGYRVEVGATVTLTVAK
jgi:eukaryotic-like serine/threonine-protein kinase